MGGRTATVDDMSGFGFCGSGVVVRCFRHGNIVVGEKESGGGVAGMAGWDTEGSPPKYPGVQRRGTN